MVIFSVIFKSRVRYRVMVRVKFSIRVVFRVILLFTLSSIQCRGQTDIFP